MIIILNDLFFSAHNSPSCRLFISQLREVYIDLIKQGKDFEVVFCSSDQNDNEFQECFSSMPWKAIPFESIDIRNNLTMKYGIKSIPNLVVVDEKTGLYNGDGYNCITKNPSGFPWKSRCDRNENDDCQDEERMLIEENEETSSSSDIIVDSLYPEEVGS